MKTKRKLFLCAALALVLLASLFGIGRSHYGAVNAEENTEGVFLKISSTNLSFDDNIYIYFRAYYDGINVSDASSDNYGMIFWKTEVAEAERTFENAQTLAASGSSIIIEKCDDWQNLPINAQGDKKNVATYKYKVAAKEMADVIYAEPYALKGGVYYYGKTIEYSVAAYASRRLGFYHGVAGSANENFINLLNAMVNYGTLAQKYFNYNVDNLMSEVVSAGKHATLTHIEALAPTCTEAGHAEYWKCECGQLFADADGKTTLEAIPTLAPLGHDLVTDTCTHCTRCNYRKPSDGLVYTLNADGASYSVTGIGTATDTFIVIAPEYNSLPVTAIGANAFYNQSQVIGVETPKSIESIEEYAFYACYNFAEIDFKGNLLQWLQIDHSKSRTLYKAGNLYINGSLFSNIIIPQSITTIGKCAFLNCANITNVKLHNQIVAIDDSAFANCKNLTSISLPDSVVTLGNSVFQSCSSLVNVDLGNSIEIIGNYAFARCYSIKRLSIPDSTLTIGDYAFQGDYNTPMNITELTIGANVTTIGSWAFYNCSRIQTINYMGDVESWFNINLKSTPVSNNDFFIKGKLLENVIFPENLHVLKNQFPNTSHIKSVTIPITITSVGHDYFRSWSNLEEVNYLGDIESWCNIVFESSFSNPCYYAKKFLFNGEKQSEVSIPDSVKEIKNYTFLNFKSILKIKIPESVTEIGNSSFAGCSALVNIELPNSLVKIGYDAFNNCSGLTNITIPANINSIGNSAFGNCSLYKITNNSEILFETGSTDYGAIAQNTVILTDKNKNTTITKNYIVENDFLFKQNGDTYQLIAYLGAETNIVLPTKINGNTYSLSKFKGAINVTVPKEINITESAFEECHSLTTATVHHEWFGKYAFKNCINLKYFHAENIEKLSLSHCMFFGCYNLTSLNHAISAIDDSAFSGCSSLNSVFISKSLSISGYNAFLDCNNLSCIYYAGSISTWRTIRFDNYAGNPLYYAEKILFNNKDEVLDFEITGDQNNYSSLTIKAYAFENCKSMKTLKINGVKWIDNYAFELCKNLTEVTFYSRPYTLGKGLFFGSGLQKINFNGTMSQWKSISKVTGWNEGTWDFVIYCTDGKLNKNDNEITD